MGTVCRVLKNGVLVGWQAKIRRVGVPCFSLSFCTYEEAQQWLADNEQAYMRNPRKYLDMDRLELRRERELQRTTKHKGRTMEITYRDEFDNPVDLEEVITLLRRPITDRRVDYDVLDKSIDGRKIIVSTVWLGFPHPVYGNSLDSVMDSVMEGYFETMIFLEGERIEDLFHCRYRTRDEAQAGHDWIIKKMKSNPEYYLGDLAELIQETSE